MVEVAASVLPNQRSEVAVVYADVAGNFVSFLAHDIATYHYRTYADVLDRRGFPILFD